MSRWQEYSEKFIELTQREKIIIAFTAVFLVTYGLYFVLIEPTLKNKKAIVATGQTQQQQLSAVREQISAIQQALQKDPNEPIKLEIVKLKETLNEVELELALVMTQYVAPEKMTAELTRLLSAESSLRVTGLTTLEPIEIEVPSKITATQSGDLNDGTISTSQDSDIPRLFSHRFELVVTGEYFPLMNFVKKVLDKNNQFSVNDLKYEVIAHPKAQLTLSLVTISDSENVIRL